MNINTLLNVLFQNGQQDLVALAVQIDNEIPFAGPQIGETVRVELYTNDIKSTGYKFKRGSYGIYACTLVAVNHYMLKNKYCVQTPDGKLKWCNITDNDLSEVEEIPTPLVVANLD